MLLLEGPAGIGKTSLLRSARDVAEQRGLVTLAATASPLDRDFPFGLVLQLLGPALEGADDARRERLLAGAAGRARELLVGDGEVSDVPSHALLHGLYWLSANLAELAPLLLVVDDLQWADVPSLRYLEFLGRRLDGLPLAVVAAVRTGEPGADLDLLGALAAGPTARTLTLAPLTEEGARDLIADALGEAPDVPFLNACRAATGGNPLLLRELVRAAAENHLHGRAGEAGRVQAMGSAGIAAAVERRLKTLGPASRAVARAAAVLGSRGRADDLAALAGIDPEEASAMADRLVRADILDPGGRSFVHPLVGEAVLAATPSAELSRLHAQAADRLLDRGARSAEVAAHVLATAPAGKQRTVDLLRSAARIASAEGAPATAVAYLRRALEEPPRPEERARVLLELGEAEADHGVQGAADRLDRALAEGLEGDEAVRARAARARYAILRDPRSAIEDLEAAAAAAAEPALRLRLESLLLDVTAYEPAFDSRRQALLEAARRDPDPSPVMLAHLAQDAAYRSAPTRRSPRSPGAPSPPASCRLRASPGRPTTCS